MSERAAYLRDGTAIYERSFAIIRAEADLTRFSADEADVAVRMIHACGQVDVAAHFVFGGNLVAAARGALAAGAPIFCDAEMVARGITRARLPAHNDVICTLNDPRTATLAANNATTRSAAALDLWLDRLRGAFAWLDLGFRIARRPRGLGFERLGRRGSIVFHKLRRHVALGRSYNLLAQHAKAAIAQKFAMAAEHRRSGQRDPPAPAQARIEQRVRQVDGR